MSTKKKNADYLKQGGILAMASLIVRIIGMVYRIPMSNILGEEGNGIYAVAFEIYDLILIISSYSLPLALSKMISARQANREHKNTGRILKVALRFAIISGGAFALILACTCTYNFYCGLIRCVSWFLPGKKNHDTDSGFTDY